jgi:hypothetical protein
MILRLAMFCAIVSLVSCSSVSYREQPVSGQDPVHAPPLDRLMIR